MTRRGGNASALRMADGLPPSHAQRRGTARSLSSGRPKAGPVGAVPLRRCAGEDRAHASKPYFQLAASFPASEGNHLQAATASPATSLRAQQSNPECAPWTLDCFVSFASAQ
jgi:hypothetical protein